MSKINGDQARQNLRDRRNTKMREKMRALRQKLNDKAKAAGTAKKAS